MTIAQNGEADVVLMDVSLAHSNVTRENPWMGLKFNPTAERPHPDTANLPVILVTAHAMDGDRENFLAQSGADGYISKPVCGSPGLC